MSKIMNKEEAFWGATFIATILFFYFGPSITKPKSEWRVCKYAYKVDSPDYYAVNLFTNDLPGPNGCFKTTEGEFCGNFTFTKTIKDTEECLPQNHP